MAVTTTAPALDFHPYAPRRIDAYLRQWLAVESGAETPASTRHYWSWEHRNEDGACETAPRLDQGKRYHGDPMDGADVRADLEAAIALLPAYSLESAVVHQRIKAATLGHVSIAEGYFESPTTFAAMARALGRRKSVVRDAYYRALEMMAKSLGWESEES